MTSTPTLRPAIDTAEPTATERLTETPEPTILPSDTPTSMPTIPPEAAPFVLSVDDRDRVIEMASLALSADGRIAVYSDYDPSFPSHTLYRRDFEAGTVEVIEVDQDNVWPVALSADGSIIAFFANTPHTIDLPCRLCTDFTPDERGGRSIFVYDVGAGAIVEFIPVDGLYGGQFVALSADGRFVAFSTSHAWFHEGAYIYDRQTGGLTTLAAGPNDDLAILPGIGHIIDISDDGRYAAYARSAEWIENYEDGDGSTYPIYNAEVYLYDRVTGEEVRVDAPVDGRESGYPSGFDWTPNTGGGTEHGLAISGDGRFVAFMSRAPNLTDRDDLAECAIWGWSSQPSPACRQTYVYDRETGSIEVVSVSSDGVPADGPTASVQISDDGRYVLFIAHARNLVDDPIVCDNADWCPQAYVYDRETGRTILISRGAEGAQQLGFQALTLAGDASRAGFSAWYEVDDVPAGIYVGYGVDLDALWDVISSFGALES